MVVRQRGRPATTSLHRRTRRHDLDFRWLADLWRAITRRSRYPRASLDGHSCPPPRSAAEVPHQKSMIHVDYHRGYQSDCDKQY
jgi:hypothetical protein